MFAECLQSMGLSPFKNLSQIKDAETNYKCVAVYGDGLAFAMEDPETFFNK